MLKTHLELARASNLPTVWSNIIAALLIAGQANLTAIPLCIAGSLFYIAGMYLNDFFDADYDQQHRPERPIPSKRITRRSLLFFAIGYFIVGLIITTVINPSSLLFALPLVGCILWYDIDHKDNPYSPLTMAGCRALLFIWAGSTISIEFNLSVYIGAIVLFAYIAGLSYLPRNLRIRRLLTISIAALSLPIWLSITSLNTPLIWIALLIFICWTGRSLVGIFREKPKVDFTISGLLAGIIWVDLLAIFSLTQPSIWVFASYALLFIIALITQRKISAT
ncbi:MAG: UbiA family prenyltransferase [Opitutaceae bacterium]